MESAPPKDHDVHIAVKGFNSSSDYILVHKFVPMPQAMTILDAKAAVDKREKLEKLRALQMTKVKGKKEVILEAHEEQRTVHFATLTDVISKMRSWNRSEVQRGRAPR